jgi:hypothetical protein
MLEENYVPSNDEIEGSSDFSEICSDIIDQNRWETLHETIYKHTPTGRFFSVQDWRGSTEMQYNDSEPEVNEVWPKAITQIIYTTEKPE